MQMCRPTPWLAALALAATASLAMPAAASTIGADLGVAGTGTIVATFEDQDAGCDSDLYVQTDGGNILLFSNPSAAVGTTCERGVFAAGTVLTAISTS